MAGTLSAGVNSLILKLDTPYDTIRTDDVRDDLIKVKVWCSATPNFTRVDTKNALGVANVNTNQVFDGLSLSIVIPKLADGTAIVAGTPYYVRYAFISDIEEEVFTVSQQLTATPVPNLATKSSVAYLYQWSTAQPGNPSGESTYTWLTAASSNYTGGNNWLTSIATNPGTSGIKLWTASKAVTAAGDALTTTVSWTTGSTIAAISQNGTFGTPGLPGVSSARAILYKPAINTVGAGSPIGQSTYYWATSSFAYANTATDGWSLAPPSSSTGLEGQTLWAALVVLTDSLGSEYTNIDWTSAAIVAQSYYGTQGTPGLPGTPGTPSTVPGAQGVSARIAYVVTAAPYATPAGTPLNKVETGDTLPATGTWFTGKTWVSNAPTTPLAEGEYLYQVNGLYNPLTNSTNWIGIPYLSNLKVGNLSALAINTGDLNVTGTIKVFGNTTNGILIDGSGISIYNDSKLRVRLGSI
jgi:hypothetical protein